MFCIAAFIVLAFIAIFSASFRPLAKKAWHCVLRRVTFRPCDIDFSEEMKGKLLGRIIVTHPKLARFLDRWIDWLAFIFVVLSIWSVLYTATALLNLYVYDTCSPTSVESCSLGGEACGVDQSAPGLIASWQSGNLLGWVTGPFTRTFTTITRIPDRLRTWDAREFVGPTATYIRPFDASKPTALEIIDPSCQFCKKLTSNVRTAGIPERMNVTYLLYPIPSEDSGTKFPHSGLLAGVIEAVKRMPLPSNPSAIPADWQLLEKIFVPAIGSEPDLQSRFAIGFTRVEAEHALRELLLDIGYSSQNVDAIFTLAESPEIIENLRVQAEIVEKRIRTIKIPTLLIGGRRYDRSVSVEELKRYSNE